MAAMGELQGQTPTAIWENMTWTDRIFVGGVCPLISGIKLTQPFKEKKIIISKTLWSNMLVME